MDTEKKLNQMQSMIDTMQKELDTLKNEYQNHRHTGLDTRQIDGTSLEETPFAKVVNPTTAGLTYSQTQIQSIVDAVDSIITILETTKITSDQ